MVEIDKPSDYFHTDAEGNCKRPKSARRIAHISCADPRCSKYDDPKLPKFKRCANCRTFYCSKECQKADWKSHKSLCAVLAPESGKILMDIATSPLLRTHFAILVVLKFGLHLLDAKALEEISHKPLEMDVYIQHEPANIRDFLHLFSISNWQNTPPMMGIPQIVDVRVEKQDLISDKDSMKQWIACREDELSKRPDQLAIVVNVRYHQTRGGIAVGSCGNMKYLSAGTHSVFAHFKISPHAFTIVKEGKYPPVFISFDGFKYEWLITQATMNVENHIEFINAEIRWDIEHENQFRLAAKLPDFEKQMISHASAAKTSIHHPESVEFINFIREKVRREKIYRMAAAYYEHESEVIPKVSSKDLKGIRVLP